jgi:hypothetical protein
MTPANLAFYAVFARRLLADQGPVCQYSDGFLEQYLDQLAKISGPDSGTVEKAEADFRDGMSPDQFQSRKSHVKRALQSALGPQVAAPYLIDDDDGDADAKDYAYTRYRLNLPPDAVRFGCVDADVGALQVQPANQDRE